MKKKVLSLALALVMCLGLTAPALAAGRSAFSDVPADAYYADAVEWAVNAKITAGTTNTTFSPGQTCTTAQILTFLWRSQGQPEPAGKNPFADVSADAYYYKAALWAYEKGLVSGKSLNGGAPCTRSATVTYLWKLAGSPSAPAAKFTDVPGSAGYAKAVAWAVSKGITGGTSATAFSPDATCTRGQIVTFLYRNSTGAAAGTTASGKQGLAAYGLEPNAELNKQYPYPAPCYSNKSVTTTGTVEFMGYTRRSLGNGYDEIGISIIYTFSDDNTNTYGYTFRAGATDYYLYTDDDEQSADDMYAGVDINWNGKTYTDCSMSGDIIQDGWVDEDTAIGNVYVTAKIPAGYDGFVVCAYRPPVDSGAKVPLSACNNLIMFRCT